MKKLLTFIILSIFLLGACEKEKTADKFEAYRDALKKSVRTSPLIRAY